MSEPLVCAVLLTRDRPEMAQRAVASFRAQTYERASIVCLDTGTGDNVSVPYSHMPKWANKTIGFLRNEANAMAGNADIICHFDSDDWSHPNRIAEQVALLQSSGAECAGYNKCLFWDTRKCISRPQAWLYCNSDPRYCLGSSMMYWRKTWESVKFDDVSHGEDERFRAKVKSVGVNSERLAIIATCVRSDPRMICSIHDSNTSVYKPEAQPANWQRVAGLDAYCERTMKL